MNVFDILGPVMIGPSSSHTAGAARIGLVTRALLGKTPVKAHIFLHGSFAKTYKGHGTDKALVAGILGMQTDDERIRFSLDVAKMEVALTGQNPALIVLHKDAPGTIAAVTELMAEYGVNICNFHLARETKGGVAVMTIESDSHFASELNEKINRLENIYSSTMLERV